MNFVCMHRWFVAVAVIVLVPVAPSPALAECPCETQPSGFAGGDGTPGNPFQVCMPSHLDNVRNHMSSNFVQTADIDMSGFGNFTPIGSIGSQFLGRYDGSNFEIQNISIIQPGSEDVGLFGVIGSEGVITQIELANATVVGLARAAALVGLNFGTVSLSKAQAAVSNPVGNPGTNTAGGLVGMNSGNVTLCSSTGSVMGLFRVGGLVGELSSGGVITNSYSRSSVSACPGGNVICGLVGIVRVSSTIENTYSTGEVLESSGKLFGGLIGIDQGGTIAASFWDVDTSG